MNARVQFKFDALFTVVEWNCACVHVDKNLCCTNLFSEVDQFMWWKNIHALSKLAMQ
jgi:hypothetical protein